MIDPRGQRSDLDETYSDGPHKGKTFFHSYRVEGDKLHLAGTWDAQFRPMIFSGRAGSRTSYSIWKRVTPQATKHGIEELQGKWVRPEQTRVIDGTKWKGDNLAYPLAGTIKLVAVKGDVLHIDWTVNEGPFEGQTAPCIVRREGNKLHWCHSLSLSPTDGFGPVPPGYLTNGFGPRPSEFKTGGGNFYEIWELRDETKAKVGSLSTQAKGGQQGSELKEGKAIPRIVSDYFDNLSRNQSVKNLDLFISPTSRVVGISQGAGPDIIWRKTAKEFIEGEGKERQVEATVDATHVEMLNDTLAVAKARVHNQYIGSQWVFTFTSEGGRWRIASLVFQTDR